MIVVTSRIRVTAGDADALAAQYRRRLHLAEREPGCRGVEVLRHADFPDEFTVVSRWDDRGAYDRYRASAAFRAAHERVAVVGGGLKVARVERGVDVYEVLA